MSETKIKNSKTKENTQKQLDRIAERIERRAAKAGSVAVDASGIDIGYYDINTPRENGGINVLERDPYRIGKSNQLKLHHYDREAGKSTTIISDSETGELAFGAIDANKPKESIQLFENSNPDITQVRQAAADQIREMKEMKESIPH